MIFRISIIYQLFCIQILPTFKYLFGQTNMPMMQIKSKSNVNGTPFFN